MNGYDELGTYLPVTPDNVFAGGNLFQRHGTASMQLLGRDTYLCAQSELRSVRKGSGGIVVDTGCINMTQEQPGRLLVVGNDALAMARTILPDVGKRLIQTLHDADT